MDGNPHYTPEAQVIPSSAGQMTVNAAMGNLDNPSLPQEVFGFKPERLQTPYNQLTESQWLGALHATEVEDMKQQITLRPWFAASVFVLIIVQNIGIWFIIKWSLERDELAKLQLIFSTLIGGTLTQSYFILRFITNKIFSDIDYHNGDRK